MTLKTLQKFVRKNWTQVDCQFLLALQLLELRTIPLYYFMLALRMHLKEMSVILFNLS